MKIAFISVGRMSKPHFKAAFADYAGRLGRYFPFDDISVAAGVGSTKAAKSEVRKKEGERILSKIAPGDLVVALVASGRKFDTDKFAAFIESSLSGGKKRICIVTGGAFGLSAAVEDRADIKWSLSPMTLPHEMAAVVAAEQLYRAFTIIRGEPYSH